jgi:hypothetical protein
MGKKLKKVAKIAAGVGLAATAITTAVYARRRDPSTLQQFHWHMKRRAEGHRYWRNQGPKIVPYIGDSYTETFDQAMGYNWA